MKGAIAVLLLAVLHSTMSNAAPTEPNKFFPSLKNNLTNVIWAHAVNSQAELKKALEDSSVMMLEADVIVGTLTDKKNITLPIMAHPPNTTSDLSLEDFVKAVTDKKEQKGLKLDFKSQDAFEKSNAILKNLNDNAKFPVFINADIFPGPVKADNPVVNPMIFLDAAKKYENLTLSIGWTTKPEGGNNATQTQGYTQEQVQNAIKTLKTHNVTQLVTYAVRANFAAVSPTQMEELVNSTDVKNSTLTIWSGKDDMVNETALSTLIKKIGVQKVYLDVPQELKSKLNLDGSGASGITITTMTMLGSLFVNFLLTAMPRRG